MTDALYLPDGERFVPTELTTGPWDARAQHGGAPSALLAHLIEQVETPGPMQVARLTYELLRPVPLAPLAARTQILRPGRKVQLVEASLLTDDNTEVMRATALRIRTAELPVPDVTLPEDQPPGEPDHGAIRQFPHRRHEGPAFYPDACEIRFVDGGFDRPGPATAWIRLKVPVIDGTATTALMRLAAASDFGNGVSWTLPRDGWTFINPDLSVHLTRLPEGDWVGLRSITHPGHDGIGLAESAIYDQQGRIGRAVQSLLLDHSPG
jgi:hypothetical protein